VIIRPAADGLRLAACAGGLRAERKPDSRIEFGLSISWNDRSQVITIPKAATRR
jgi:hypothetical protein